MSLLQVKDLRMYYRLANATVKAVDGISFDLERGENLGLVGESGCGKTSLGLSILRIFPSNAEIVDGQILFEDVDLTELSEDEMRNFRWNKISMIFQNAMNALNPVFKVEDQLVEALKVHKHISVSEAERKAKETLELVGLSPSRADNYPHEFSGGMKQRVIIAMSMICSPALIIADEPTTGLDVIVQDQILQEIEDLRKKIGAAVIWISHDLCVIAETCSRMAVMYGGRIFEYGDMISIFDEPRNPYTAALLQSIPSLQGPLKRLTSIPGSPPDLVHIEPGCPFAPRCQFKKEICKEKQPTLCKVGKDHYSFCHLAMDLDLEGRGGDWKAEY